MRKRIKEYGIPTNVEQTLLSNSTTAVPSVAAVVAVLPSSVLPVATQHTFRAASNGDFYYVVVPAVDGSGTHNQLKLLAQGPNVNQIKIENISLYQDIAYSSTIDFDTANDNLTSALRGDDAPATMAILRFSVSTNNDKSGFICFSI